MNELIDLRAINKPTKRQKKFIELWFTPESPSYLNAYQSALAAGFSESTSRVITGNARNMPWVQYAKQLFASGLEPEHIILGLQREAVGAKDPRDRIAAWREIGKIKGMYIERSQSEVNVNFTNSVPRPVIDGETVDK